MSVRALTCDNHGFGSKKEECVVCGKWPARNPAMVCDNHNGKCAKCGGYV